MYRRGACGEIGEESLPRARRLAGVDRRQLETVNIDLSPVDQGWEPGEQDISARRTRKSRARLGWSASAHRHGRSVGRCSRGRARHQGDAERFVTVGATDANLIRSQRGAQIGLESADVLLPFVAHGRMRTTTFAFCGMPRTHGVGIFEWAMQIV